MQKNLLEYMYRFWTHSLRRQLMLGITLVHAVLMTIFVFDLIDRQRDFMHEQHVAQTVSLAETLSTNSVSWVLANDVVGLEEIIHSQLGYPGLQYAMVLSPAGRVLAHSNKTFIGQYATDEISQRLQTASSQVQRLQTGLALVDIAAPIMTNGDFIGWARVAVGGEDIASGLQVISRNGVIYTFIAILVGGIFAFIMARGMTTDLQKLVIVADSVSAGGTVRVSLERKDEIGVLANDFNHMLDSLEQNAHSQRMLEQELRARRDSLEAQVKDRTRELELARDDAIQATITKSAFLASMSHELRTPLNSIIGFTGLVLDGVAGDLNDEQKKQLGMVYSSSRHLLELINDILDLSKVESGKLEASKESFEVTPLLVEVYDMMNPLAETKGLTLELNDASVPQGDNTNQSQDRHRAVTLFTDRGKLRQVLINLLGNAIKFTRQGSVWLSCSVQDDSVLIAVEDTGIGIDDEYLIHIFDTFQQVDSGDTRQQEGTGLGLAISRQFMKLLGGTLDVISEPGKGSIFTLSLPIDTQQVVRQRPLARMNQVSRKGQVKNLANEHKKKLVLVVDDQAEARDLMQQYLQREGYEVLLSDHHDDALYQARVHQPFAITLDILMPKPDGWTILASLKATPETANIPVILISVLDEKNLALSLGAVDYLQKPIVVPNLLAILEQLQLNGNNVLVVDDRIQDAELLVAMLEPKGYQVKHVDSGASALASVGDEAPDLILLDLMMPNMSGFEVIRRLRTGGGKSCNVPIIVVSAKSLTEAEHEYLQENVEQVLVKGQFDKKIMLKEVSSLLANIERSTHSVSLA